ncbi:MAG: ABC transporter ATP-binding protein [Proteobacteria bacterium]|nr:ABC transporter ATP-binding protein [Pseudomonadota bacterium]
MSAPRSGLAAFRVFLRDIAGFAGSRGIFAAIYIALGAVFESVGLVLVVPLLAVVMGSGDGGRLQNLSNAAFASFGVTTPVGRMIVLLAGFAVIMVLRAIIVSLRDNAVQDLQNDWIEDLRGRVSNRLADAGWDRVMRLRHARVLNVLSSDIQRVGGAAHYVLVAGIALVVLAVQVALSFILAPGLALIALALLAFSALALIPALRRARAMGHYLVIANLGMTESASQFLGGLKLALSQDLQGTFVAEYRETMLGLRRQQRRYFHLQTRWRTWATTLTAIVGASVVLIGFAEFHIPAPILITFLIVIGRMAGPATMVQQGFQQLAQGLPAFESVTTLMSELNTGTLAALPERKAVPRGPIVFSGVSRLHAADDGDGPKGVRDVSLTIAPGSFVGVAGSSGAGKTTFADLLVGLTSPQSGSISIGGVPLDESVLPAWRAGLSYVSQDPFLFHDTVRRNLAWVRPQATEAQMWDALALAGADGIVRRMEGGLDAIVGERGSLVSGGERQRIALARALLRKPSLLVLDEATNAIDVDGEKVLVERLLAIEPRMTIVMIAHRAESLALCDRVLTMTDGMLRAA